MSVKRRIWTLLSLFIVVAMPLAACQSRTVEVTRLAKETIVETVEVTRLVKETVFETVVETVQIVNLRCPLGCSDTLTIRLKGNLPETLTVKATDLNNSSVVLYCAEDDKGEKLPYQFERFSLDDPTFKDVSQVLPSGLCEAKASASAAAYFRNDASIDRLFVFCSDTPGKSPPRAWSHSECRFTERGRVKSVRFVEYMPCQATFTLFLPDRTVTKTVTPDYTVRQFSTPRLSIPRECETWVTIDLGN
jgi:hypothetical protein